MIYKRDLDFGFKMENDLFDTIKNKYGENICKTEPKTPILDAVVRAKQIVKNLLEQELKAIKESEVKDG